jgi:hypothetical protein
MRSAMLAMKETNAVEAGCLKFATSFYTAMPREVRDLVYSYLCDPKRYLPEGLISNKNLPRGEGSGRTMPHWHSKDFVGLEFARGCTEYFYENTELHFETHGMINIMGLKDELQHGGFGCGLVPADFVRACMIDLNAHYDRNMRQTAEFEEIEDQVKALVTLKRTAHVIFRICRGDVDECHNFELLLIQLKYLVPLFYTLKERGLSFSVVVWSGFDFSNFGGWPDITFLWDMPKVELKAKTEGWVAAQSKWTLQL